LYFVGLSRKECTKSGTGFLLTSPIVVAKSYCPHGLANEIYHDQSAVKIAFTSDLQ